MNSKEALQELTALKNRIRESEIVEYGTDEVVVCQSELDALEYTIRHLNLDITLDTGV